MNQEDAIKAVNKTIIESLEWYMKTHNALSDLEAQIVVDKINELNIVLAKYAIKYGADFYNENMSMSVLRLEQLYALLE